MRITKRDKITGAARKAAPCAEAEVLERLCAFEDAAEDVGLEGPYAVAAILRVAKEGIGKRMWKYLGEAGEKKKSAAQEEGPERRCCGDCRFFNRQMYFSRGECRITMEEVRMRGGNPQRMRRRRVSDGEESCKFFQPLDPREIEARLEHQKIIGLFRDYCDLDQGETAEYLGVTTQTLQRWENLRSFTNADEVLRRLCALTGWSWPLFRVVVLGVPLEQAAREQKEEKEHKQKEKGGESDPVV